MIVINTSDVKEVSKRIVNIKMIFIAQAETSEYKRSGFAQLTTLTFRLPFKMMKITLFTLAAIALVAALPQDQPQAQPVQIVKQDSEVNINGYNFEYETSDGTSRQEQGEYKNDTEQQGLSVKGSYKYIAPDGQHISVTFLADKNGYQPSETTGEDKPAQP
ncbi:unnamed protein product, partial [Brenthis ino]